MGLGEVIWNIETSIYGKVRFESLSFSIIFFGSVMKNLELRVASLESLNAQHENISSAKSMVVHLSVA